MPFKQPPVHKPKLKAPPGPRLRLRTNTVTAGTQARRGSQAFQEQTEEARELVQDITWTAFLKFFRSVEGWKQGEHVTLFAATGQGKTTLALEILPIRKYMVAFATKAKDERLYPTLKAQGFQEQERFASNPEHAPKVLLKPPFTGKASLPNQRKVFEDALADIFKAGGWGLYLDELKYVTDNLKLAQDLELLYLQGRSLGVSIVGTSQRPAWIPLVALSQATHLFIGIQSDQIDVDRVAQASGRKGPIVKAVTPELEDYQFLYVNTRTTKVPVYRVRVEL